MMLIEAPKSAAFQHTIDIQHVGFIVDYHPIQLYPGMRPKWEDLRPDYHLRRYAVMAQQ
jgi:hypothetical protein